MSIAQSEICSRLVQSGLADVGISQRYRDAFVNSSTDSADDDGKAFAGFLVRSGLLTKYQAAKLLESEHPDLRAGSFVITSDQPVPPFSHWIPVQSAVTTAAPTPRHGFLLRVPLSSLDETRRGWLAVHSEIRSESLQSIELSGGAQSGGADQTVEIFSPLPDGGSLCKVLETRQSLSTRKTIRIGVDLAAAFEALHTPTASGLVIAHGAIGADHVWVTPKGHAILLRDPSAAARSPRADLSTSWIDRIESPATYAAPELADPAALPSPASDIYSLGCLLFALHVGHPAFSGDSDRELFAAHNEAMPTELIEAVEQGAAGNPVLRVLAYAMAKDPSARFESAAAMADALLRAGELAETNQKSRRSTKKKSKPSPAPAAAPPPTEAVAAASAVPAPPSPATATVPSVATADPAETVARAPAETVKKAAAPPRPSADESPSPEEPPESTAPPPAPTIAPPPTPASSPDATSTAPPEPETAEPAETISVGEMPASADGESDRQSALAPRRRRKRRKNRIPILAGMMVLPLLMLGLAIALRGRGPAERPPRPRPKPGIADNVPKVPDSRRDVVVNDGPTMVNGYEIVQSDRLLWVPPYSADSAAPSLELLPPGPAAIVSIPLSRVLSSPDAAPLMSTFSTELEPLIAMIEQRCGVGRDQIARCTAALFPGKNGWPEVALAIELIEPADITSLSEKWNAVESRINADVIVYAGEELDDDAYFIGGGEKGKPPEDGKVQRFSIGSLERVREVAENDGGAIPLVRSMQTLWNQTSAESDFVALVTPNFLFADGREMLAVSAPELRSPLKQWLIPDVTAFSLTLSANDAALYVELGELPSGGATSATLLKSFRETIASWPNWADEFILESVPDPSWRLLATRLPLMLRFVGEHTRSTIVGESVVASAYLPVDAGAQVALATLLAMNTEPGGQRVAQQSEPTKPLTVAEMLDRPMSISFLQLSLQFAVDAVVDEFKQTLPADSTMPAVRIIGSDLEKNGITQNQQIRGFERDGQPLRNVLTDLVLGANPDKTATGPTDPKQSLVWVVHPQGKPPEETEILITTRDAAAGNYELPPEFQITAPQ